MYVTYVIAVQNIARYEYGMLSAKKYIPLILHIYYNDYIILHKTYSYVP